MARLFLTNIDLNTNELQNAVIQNLSSAPLTGNKEGRIYYDTVAKALYLYTNGAWKPLASGGAAASSLELTGDVTGTANVDPATGKITLDTTVVNNSVTLGDDTTGDYVAGINGTTNEIVVDNSGGEGSTPTISLPNEIYKPTTFAIGYQEGFDITFNGGDGDTYLNQTTGDGTVHVIGAFTVDYGSTNNPQYSAFRVEPGGAIVDVRNVLNVNNDYGMPAFIVEANSSVVHFNDSAANQNVLDISNSDLNAEITAAYSLNLTTNSGDISLNPSTNVVNIGNGYGELHLQKTEYSRGGQLQGIIAAQSDGSLRITGNNNGLQLETNNGGIFLNPDNGWTTFNNNVQISSEGEIYAQQGDLTLTGDSGNVVINNNLVTDTIQSKNAGTDSLTISGGNSNIHLDSTNGRIELNPDSILYVNGGAQFANNVTIAGDLNVQGTLNAVNRTEINIEDNTIRLNTGFTGAPDTDAGIIVTRGTANDTAIIWNETNDQWTLSNDGNNYYAIARKYVEVIGDTSNTSFDVVHNLGTRDITVMVRENNAEYNVVETDIRMKDGNTVTIAFTDAPALNAYKVIIVG